MRLHKKTAVPIPDARCVPPAEEGAPAATPAGADANECMAADNSGWKGIFWIWACLGVLLVVYLFSAFRLGTVGWFGRTMDDTIYFSSAKALARGQGYAIPSFPVALKSTKYPVLYPLVLAGIWKIDPHFPGNVNLAVGLTLVFGCAALLFAFLLLRRWPGMGDWPALIAVALVALTSHFILLSADVLSDVPFAALLLAAVYLAETSLRRDRSSATLAALAGALAALSIGLRSLGIAVGAGIGLAFLLKRKYRRLGWFCATAMPLGLFFFWPALVGLIHPSGPRLPAGPGDSGWTQTLCWYSSYACDFRMNVTDFRTLASVVKGNLLHTSLQPGAFLTQPLLNKAGLWSVVPMCLLSFGAWVGILRHWRKASPEPYVLTFLFMLALILPWPYPTDRFLLPFLPLLFGGFVMEARSFVSLVATSLRTRRAALERAVGGLLGLAGLALAATIAVNYLVSIPVQNARLASQVAGSLADRRGAYAWIRRNAAPGAKVIAYEDGLLYLYTGRKAIRPIDCLTQVYYLGDRSYAKRDASRLFDVARHIGASYWMVAPGDYQMETTLGRTLLLAKEKQLLATAPLVFKSPDGAVRLYDVRGLMGARPETKN